MEQAAEILKHVEQPLQLAAVALLAIYGITKALIATNRWTPSDRIVTLFLNRAFALGLLALVLAVGGPLLARAVDADDLIDGSVYGADNAAIRNATVSAPPLGAQPVNYDGSFELRVPNHRKRDAYDITASADGFKSETRTVARAQLRSVDFKLQPKPESAIRQFSPEIVVAQYFGLPAVIVSMQVKSPGNTQSYITDITAQLEGEHVGISLPARAGTINGIMGPYSAISMPIPIDPGVQKTFRFLLIPYANFSQIFSAIGNLPDYAGRQPCAFAANGMPTPLTDQAFDIVQTYARSKFMWSPGDWALHFKITVGDRQETFDKSFKLTEAETDALRQSMILLKSCLANNFQNPLGQDGVIANYVTP